MGDTMYLCLLGDEVLLQLLCAGLTSSTSLPPYHRVLKALLCLSLRNENQSKPTGRLSLQGDLARLGSKEDFKPHLYSGGVAVYSQSRSAGCPQRPRVAITTPNQK